MDVRSEEEMRIVILGIMIFTILTGMTAEESETFEEQDASFIEAQKHLKEIE